jgi:hypothetical protein
MVLGDVHRAAFVIDQPDQPFERIALVLARLLAEISPQRLANVGGLGSTGPRGESLQRTVRSVIEVELLPPYTSEYTSRRSPLTADRPTQELAGRAV